MNVILTPHEYQRCLDASQHFWANSKKGTYGKGLCNSQQDPTKATRTGLLGELAFSKVLKVDVDFSYKENGDKYDALLGDLTVDFKCSRKNYGEGLIYHSSESGRKIPLDKDIYAFSFINYDNPKTQEASVTLVGFATRQDVLDKAVVKKGYLGTHLNYVISHQHLKPIEDLIKLTQCAKFAALF